MALLGGFDPSADFGGHGVGSGGRLLSIEEVLYQRFANTRSCRLNKSGCVYTCATQQISKGTKINYHGTARLDRDW